MKHMAAIQGELSKGRSILNAVGQDLLADLIIEGLGGMEYNFLVRNSRDKRIHAHG